MKPILLENAGFPDRLLYTLSVIAGNSVANLYHNQPLLEMIREVLGATDLTANHIILYSQYSYALGLFFPIPTADLYCRRRIPFIGFTQLILVLLATASLAITLRAGKQQPAKAGTGPTEGYWRMTSTFVWSESNIERPTPAPI